MKPQKRAYLITSLSTNPGMWYSKAHIVVGAVLGNPLSLSFADFKGLCPLVAWMESLGFNEAAPSLGFESARTRSRIKLINSVRSSRHVQCFPHSLSSLTLQLFGETHLSGEQKLFSFLPTHSGSEFSCSWGSAEHRGECYPCQQIKQLEADQCEHCWGSCYP